jgi:hypothetical protein
MVSVGFAVAEVGKVPDPSRKRFGWSKLRRSEFTTALDASAPILTVPMICPAPWMSGECRMFLAPSAWKISSWAFSAGVEAIAGVLIEVVMDLRQGNAIGIALLRVEGYAVFSIGRLLHKRSHPDLSRCCILEGCIQFLAAQTLCRELGRGGGRRSGGPAVTVIADFDPEGAPFLAEIAIAEIFYPRGRERAAIGENRLGSLCPAEPGGMIHEVAPDLIGTVGDTVRRVLLCRVQQQAWRFESMSGDDDDLAGSGSGAAVVARRKSTEEIDPSLPTFSRVAVVSE